MTESIEHHRMAAAAARADSAAAGWGGHLRATLALGVPLVGSQIGLMLINTTDTVMLGWYSVEALAAGVLATPFFFVVMIFGSGFSQAVLPIAAQAEGQGDTRGVRRAVRMGLWASAIVLSLRLAANLDRSQIPPPAGDQASVSSSIGRPEPGSMGRGRTLERRRRRSGIMSRISSRRPKQSKRSLASRTSTRR